MNMPLKFLKKFPIELNKLRISLDKNKYTSINLNYQDESRFGLMTYVRRHLTAKGIKLL